MVEHSVHTRSVICSSQIAATRPVGQEVKTPPFHGGNMGSSPVRVTKQIKSELCSNRNSVRIFCFYDDDYKHPAFRSIIIPSLKGAVLSTWLLSLFCGTFNTIFTVTTNRLCRHCCPTMHLLSAKYNKSHDIDHENDLEIGVVNVSEPRNICNNCC